MKTFTIAIIFVIFIRGFSFSQTSGASFLLEASDAKSFSLGSAFTAYSDNPSSLNINPAGLGFSVVPEISADYKKNLMDGFNSSVFFAVPMKGSGVIGVGFALYDLGSIEINNIDGTSQTLKEMQSWVANIGYSLSVVDELSLGLNFKYISSTLAEKYTGTAFAVDCGLLFRTLDSKFSYGFALQNIGTKLTYISDGDSLPFTVRTGIAYKFRDAELDSWMLTTDAVYYDSKLKWNAGVECNLFNILSLRAGYKMGYAPDALSFGAGFNISQINIDYAYSMLGGMDNVQMFTVSYKFGGQTDYDIGKAYYDKGMKDRALAILKTINFKDINYKAASKIIDDITKEKEDRKQSEIAARIERENKEKIERDSREAIRQAEVNSRLEIEKQQKLKEARKRKEDEAKRQAEVAAGMEKEKQDRLEQAQRESRVQQAEKDQKLKEEQARQNKLKEATTWAGKRVKVAVMNLEPNNVSVNTSNLVSDMLRNYLFKLGKYSVVERANIDKILKEQAFQQTGCTSTECAVEVGKLLNVQQAVVGTIGKLGQKYIINVRLVDVETAELLATESEECDKEADLIDIFKAIAKKLSQK